MVPFFRFGIRGVPPGHSKIGVAVVSTRDLVVVLDVESTVNFRKNCGIVQRCRAGAGHPCGLHLQTLLKGRYRLSWSWHPGKLDAVRLRDSESQENGLRSIY